MDHQGGEHWAGAGVVILYSTHHCLDYRDEGELKGGPSLSLSIDIFI